ncbi:MAG: helix-turn-helix transcriptional regulator [Oscillospiraceae bacterium]|nr:helix-turn-helix transcriptional regulator [Oscillospiraceae bacterium]
MNIAYGYYNYIILNCWGVIAVGDSKFLKEMGQRIMMRRKSLRMTQEELAEKLGVSTQMISNLELGKKAIRPENLVKVCDALELSADFVLTGSNTQTAVDATAKKLIQLTKEELQMVSDMIDYMNNRK